jgi:hypothetical protein
MSLARPVWRAKLFEMVGWQTIAGIVVAALLLAALARQFLNARERRRQEPQRFFAPVQGLLEQERMEETGSVGYPKLLGRYRGFPVQVLPVVDTLATRRLPALWLLVTMQDALPIQGKFDLMMRPGGATTFSNFDLLPVTIERPPGFPEEAVLRTDNYHQHIPTHVVEPHLDLFNDRRAKELLVTPNGLRIVWLLAEADRARYGVFRQAEFGDVDLDPNLLRLLLDRLIALRQSILDWHAKDS